MGLWLKPPLSELSFLIPGNWRHRVPEVWQGAMGGARWCFFPSLETLVSVMSSSHWAVLGIKSQGKWSKPWVFKGGVFCNIGAWHWKVVWHICCWLMRLEAPEKFKSGFCQRSLSAQLEEIRLRQWKVTCWNRIQLDFNNSLQVHHFWFVTFVYLAIFAFHIKNIYKEYRLLIPEVRQTPHFAATSDWMCRWKF